MTYESWRCTYQDSEQAARAAYKAAREAWPRPSACAPS